MSWVTLLWSMDVAFCFTLAGISASARRPAIANNIFCRAIGRANVENTLLSRLAAQAIDYVEHRARSKRATILARFLATLAIIAYRLNLRP